MKTYMTPEEHARLHRRRARQALGLLLSLIHISEPTRRNLVSRMPSSA